MDKKHNDILIEFPEHQDLRGILSYAEGDTVPFAIARVFWIYGIEKGKTRGGHAHRSCEEVVIAVSGSFEMFVDDGVEQKSYLMDSPHIGIYIKKNVWCELRNFAPGTVCVVLASEEYNPDGYVMGSSIN